MEMLENAIKKYHNKILTAAEVIEELIKISKEIVASDVEAKSLRAKLKVIVKRILRQFGYPPDMQLLATETVLKQAEMIANELVG